MKRTIVPHRSLLTLTAALWLLTTGPSETVRADDPLLYAPSHTAIERVYPPAEPYRGPYGGGRRVYGLRNFSPPGDDIYDPPPVYQPRGYYPGPYWPYYGYYGPRYFGPPYSPYGGYYYGGY